MPPRIKPDINESQLELITDRLESGMPVAVRSLISALHPAEIAHLLESLQPVDRKIVWGLVENRIAGEVLVELNDEVRSGLIEVTDAKDLISAAGTLESDDLVDLLRDLPSVLLQAVLEAMNKQDRARLEKVLSYDDDSAGGLMSLDTLTVRADVHIDVVLRYLRWHGKIPSLTDSLFVVDRNDSLQGILPLTVLLTSKPDVTVAAVMETDVQKISADMASAEVALLFEQRNLVSAPVVSEAGILLGRITIDDVVDVIRDEADHSLMSLAGLDEEQDMFAPVFLSAQRRAVWLGINLFTAFLASWVIGLFETTLEKVVALAVLMPIVASMGGIAGSQTLTLVIRGLALKQLGHANAHILLTKELAIGALNGLLWALVVAFIAGVWFQSARLGVLLGGAMMINLVCAGAAGVLIPMVMQRMGVDPALAGGVVLTTVTDVVGFMAFLGLASLYLV
ncbi:MAG: magnesium transporter [Gammaproteobacteria bacterium]